MLNVILVQDVRVRIDGQDILFPQGTEIGLDNATKTIFVDDFVVGFFPDEYMVVQ